MTPQDLAQAPSMLAHMENIQHMDKSELEGLFLTVIQQCGNDILPPSSDGGPASLKDIVSQLRLQANSGGPLPNNQN
jgi:hypothetical protein